MNILIYWIMQALIGFTFSYAAKGIGIPAIFFMLAGFCLLVH